MIHTTPRPQMRRPMQSAPVTRAPGASALGGGGVEASGWFDDAFDFVKDNLPTIVKAAPGVASVLSGLI